MARVGREGKASEVSGQHLYSKRYKNARLAAGIFECGSFND
jgi:hypothetical protein